MKLIFRFTQPAVLIVLALFLIGSASVARSQTLQQCKDRVSSLEQEIAVSQQVIDAKNKELDRLSKLVQKLSDQAKDSDAQIDRQSVLIGEKDKQIALYQDIHKTLQDSLATEAKIIENREQAIKDRDALIKELVKVGKRSALEKLVESLPSIAGIIALGLIK